MFSRSNTKFAIVYAMSILLFAQPVAAYGMSGKKSARSQSELTEGMIALNLGRYAEAAQHLEAAYAQKQDPMILFSLGQTYRLAGNFPKALGAFSAFLRSVSAKPRYRAKIDYAATEIELITSAQLQAASTPPTIERTTEDPGVKPGEQPPKSLEPDAVVERMEKATAQEPVATVEPAPVAPPAKTVVAATPPGLDLTMPPPTPAKTADDSTKNSIFKKWWFWSGVASAVAIGGTATWYLSRPENVPPSTSYGSIRVYR